MPETGITMRLRNRSALTPALFRKFQELIYQEAGIG